MSFVREQVDILGAAAKLTGRVAGQASLPPTGGRVLASVQALDSVVGLFLGIMERADFNPRLASCLATPLGAKVRETLLTVLEQQKKLSHEVAEFRWELAAYGRFAHARYGLQWHADSALHIASQVGWALFRLAQLDGYFSTRLLEPGSGDILLQQEPSDIEAGTSIPPTDWTMELRTALHTGGELWHLDKGLLRFLLSKVLQKGDLVCDLGAFGGHYSTWLNVNLT
eukprot:TRINITY_DN28368_c0_g1_i2.p1 TRINITY_DN28368_c0_g1~~TRINITY_DN28368_c0_g1_i2.p1  ORF type:complete len:255 (-),score=56.07 TRINITY_DN28368_c0_g1_i2:468-1148(-)